MKPIDILNKKFNNVLTYKEQLEEFYGEGIDFLSDLDGDFDEY